MTENLDLAQLREVAEKATPGNWMWVNDREDEHIRAGKFPYNHVTYTADVEDENALHIATFDPSTVLALIDRVQAVERELAEFVGTCGINGCQRPFEHSGGCDCRTLDGGEQE